MAHVGLCSSGATPRLWAALLLMVEILHDLIQTSYTKSMGVLMICYIYMYFYRYVYVCMYEVTPDLYHQQPFPVETTVRSLLPGLLPFEPGIPKRH